MQAVDILKGREVYKPIHRAWKVHFTTAKTKYWQPTAWLRRCSHPQPLCRAHARLLPCRLSFSHGISEDVSQKWDQNKPDSHLHHQTTRCSDTEMGSRVLLGRKCMLRVSAGVGCVRGTPRPAQFFKLMLEREERKETHTHTQRETSMCWSTYLCTRWLPPVCALTGNRSSNFGELRQHSNQLSYLARAPSLYF